jgi:hypothetical protein
MINCVISLPAMAASKPAEGGLCAPRHDGQWW